MRRVLSETYAASWRAAANIPTCLGLAMIGLIWLGAALHLQTERDIAQKAAIQNSGNLARAFEEHVIRSITELDRALLFLRRKYEEDPGGFDFAKLKDDRYVVSDVASYIGIIGPDGFLRLSNSGPVTVPRDLHDREHFRVHIHAIDDKPFIGKPLFGIRSNAWVIPVSRRIRHKDGSFGGVISAIIDTSYFTRLYNAIDLGTNGAVALVGLHDGVVRASENPARNMRGKIATDFLTYRSHHAAPDGWYFSDAMWNDGVRRLVSYRAVKGFPLAVAVGVSDYDIFAGPEFQRNTINYVAILTTALILLVIGFNIRKERNLSRARSDLHAQNIRFNAALNNMRQGLIMFNSEGRLVLYNQRFLQIYRLAPKTVKPGCKLSDLLRLRKAAGTFKGDPGQYVAKLVDANGTFKGDPDRNIANIFEEGKVETKIMQLPDGRFISITNQAMPGGGWVSTHEDITEQRRAEQERDRSQEFLDLIIEHAPVPIFVKDATNQRYVLVNRAGENFWGCSRSAMIGKTSHEVFPKQEADLIAARDQQLLHTGQPLVDEREIRTPSNGLRNVVSRRLTVPDADGNLRYMVGVIEDVTERKRAEVQIAHLAHHDALTGLANRASFMAKIEEAGARQRRWGQVFSVLMLDLDHFKGVNDAHGHPAGDALLKEVAVRLNSTLRETDVLARLGGDEFAIIQAGEPNQREAAAALAGRIIAAIGKPFDIDGTELNTGTSVGIALAPEHGVDSGSLLKNADLALYRAKSLGRNGSCFFELEMSQAVSARQVIEHDLRRAISQNELELHYQPIVDASTHKLCSVEALVRWRHPTKGLIFPDQFIPVAEESGLICQLGEWVLQTACHDAAGWPTPVNIAVNLSPAQFRKSNLADIVMCALAESGLAPERLELELTETALFDNANECLSMMRQFRNLGIAIVLDDFGTGYSSLSQLTIFPIDKIKIDKSFTGNMTKRADCAAIISAALTLANSLNITTTAEGVETADQARLLRMAGVATFQGYLFARPGPASQLNFVSPYRIPGIDNAA